MRIRATLALASGLLLLGASGAARAADADADGVPDPFDNCLLVPNPDQRDTNLDGYGNLCDADVSDSGFLVVNILDFIVVVGDFALPTPISLDRDLDGDGLVGMPEMILVRNAFGLPPGPSGLGCASPTTVPAAPCSANAVPGPGPIGLAAGALAILALAAGWLSRRRGRGPGLVAALVLLAAPAEAQLRVDLVWTATTGTGTPGGTSIQAAPGDTLTAQILLVPDVELVCCVALSLAFDTDLGDELDLVSVQPIAPAGFSDLTGGFPVSTQESDGSQGGEVRTASASVDILGNHSGTATLTIGELVFQATANVATDGADVFSGAFNAGIDAIGARPSASPEGTPFANLTGEVVFGTLSVDAP